MKKKRIHIHRPQSLPTLGAVVLMATSVLAFQQDPTTESRQTGNMLNEVPVQRSDRSFELFASAVENVVPAMARIVTALSSDRPADLASGVQDPLLRYLLQGAFIGELNSELRQQLNIPSWSNSGAMEPFMNAARFFGCFNFLSPAETGQSIRYILPFSTFRSGPPRGTGCAYSLIMLKNTENLNTQNGALPLVAAEDFKAEVLESKQPVLVEFWASWSRPCQVFNSVLRELASACAGKVKVVKVNADDSLDLSLLYDIQSVPTLLYFVRGNPGLRIVGTATKEAILAKLKPLSE
jgi:thioredoxin 1